VVDFLDQVVFTITVYRMPAEQTPAWRSLSSALAQGNQKTDVVIYDNSPNVAKIPDAEAMNVHYHHNPLNPGVSAAYNYAHRHAVSTGKPWLLLLDQDAQLPPDFVRHYVDAINANPDLFIFCPVVVDNHGAFSPFRFARGGGQRVRSFSTSRLPLETFRAVNSGLLIGCDVLSKAGGYDESIELDFSDIAFLEKVRHFHPVIGLVHTTLRQQLSSSSPSTMKEKLDRFYKYNQGAVRFGRRSGQELTLRLRSLARALKLSLVHRNLEFVAIHFKIWNG